MTATVTLSVSVLVEVSACLEPGAWASASRTQTLEKSLPNCGSQSTLHKTVTRPSAKAVRTLFYCTLPASNLAVSTLPASNLPASTLSALVIVVRFVGQPGLSAWVTIGLPGLPGDWNCAFWRNIFSLFFPACGAAFLRTRIVLYFRFPCEPFFRFYSNCIQ